MSPSRCSTAAATLAAGAFLVALAACGPSGPARTPTPRASGSGTSGGVPVQGSGCVTQSQAEQIWRDIDNRLNAMESDPKHASPATMSTGAALQGVQQYLAQQLVANNWTEREVDKLDSLTIIDPGCNNGTLQVRVTMTLVTDEYLKPNGQVDHRDESEGHQLHFIDFYERSGGVWKQSNFQDLDQPGPSQSPVII